MNILVIGNGFDLAHGLPTTYKDFLDFIDAYKRYKEKIEILNERERERYYFSNSTEDEFEFNCWLYFEKLCKKDKKIYEELGKLISENMWISFFRITLQKRRELGNDGWIDFEAEISRVVQAFDKTIHIMVEQVNQGNEEVKMEQQLKRPLKTLKDIMKKEIKDIERRITIDESLDAQCRIEVLIDEDLATLDVQKQKMLKDLNSLTRCLEIYLSDFVRKSKTDIEPLSEIKELLIDRVLSFNYTDTYQRIYNSDGKKHIEYDFIHGKAELEKDVESCNLVLGIDEYLTGEARDIDNEFIEFKKFYQRIYKMTGSNYMKWLKIWKEQMNEMTNPTEFNIYIYGHSLDITDKDILKRLITVKGAKTKIFYHSKKALKAQIANLVKVIGQDELIKRTGGATKTIEFQPIRRSK